MDQHTLNCSKEQCRAQDFSFAFNDSNFSDRMLQIQVLPDSQGDLTKDCKQENENRTAFSNSNPKCESSHDGSCMARDCSDISVRVKSLHVNSAILAEKSAVFYELFSNGPMETKQLNITVRISCSDEMAFDDLLQYMYSGTLRARLTKELLDVLIVADKFKVTACVDWCINAVQNLPMSTETAVLYIDLPHRLLTNDSVQQLVDSAKKFILQQFGDIEKSAEYLLDLPLSAIEALLSSDELRIESEDALFDFVIKWATKRYTNVEERRQVLSNRLCQSIRFPNMSHQKLNDVVSCNDLDSVCALKAVIEALQLKAQIPHKRSNERDYTHLPVTVVQFDTPIRECEVFWSKRKAQQMPLYSQHFRFDYGIFQFQCDPMVPPIGLELRIGVIDHDDEEKLDSDFIQAELSIRMLPSGDFGLCATNTWPLRHLTRERVFLPVYFSLESSMFDNINHFRLRLRLTKGWG